MPAPDAPLRELDDLLVIFHDAHKPPERWRVGTEAERIAVRQDSGEPLAYEGSPSVIELFDHLMQEHGWEPVREVPDGPVIALRRGRASVTLEPGAQVELSGAPYRSIGEGKAEWDAHLLELEPIVQELGLVWLGLGCQPFAKVDALGWVPKIRYRVMREYLPTRGAGALDMMLRTCTVQANLDYASEDDAMRKMRVGLRLQPLVTAMFANSPWIDGRSTDFRSYRGWVWMHMDPDRSGLLPFAWGDHARYRDYVEWALDAPMFLVKRGARAVYNTGQTFREFMELGFEGERATFADWTTHLGTLFPEVRLKNTLEVRGADAQKRDMLFALPALWKGLLYDEASFRRVEGLVDPWPFDEVQRQREGLMRRGVRGKFLGRETVDWAGQLLELAEAGLQRLGGDEDERVHLQPLRALLERAQCPADVLLSQIRPQGAFREEVMRVAAL